MEETLGALNELVQAGLNVREIGCSNFTVKQLQEAEDAAAAGPAVRGLLPSVFLQNEYF